MKNQAVGSGSGFPRVRVALLVALVLGACGGSGGGGGGGGGTGGGGGGGPDTSGSYFPLNVNDTWRYDDGSVVVVTGTQAVGPDTGFNVRTTQGTRQELEVYVKTAAGLTAAAATTTDPISQVLGRYEVLRFPLTAGSTFTAIDRALPALDYNNDGQVDTAYAVGTVTVVGFEAQTTPAGAFADTVRVRSVLAVALTLGGSGVRVTVTSTSEDWFARDIGPVRRSEQLDNGFGGVTRSDIRLTGYTVGGRSGGT